MKRLVLLFLFTPILSGPNGHGAFGQIPNVISHQGLLTDASGVPLEGSFGLTFSLYQTPTGGTALWTETHPGVPVQKGTFSVRLGSITPFGISFDQQLYLALAIDGSPEMTPRTALASVPYSFRADTAEVAMSVTGSGAFLPLSGGTMTGAITNTGDPAITMGKGNFGTGNINTGMQAFVAGSNNRARGLYATVAGGGGASVSDSNSALGDWSTVGGGYQNAASGFFAATVGGGGFNTASLVGATISGGIINTANSDYATVGGGTANIASGTYATVGGGNANIASGTTAPTVGGGQSNNASGSWATVGGGRYNNARGTFAVVGGGGGISAADSNTARGDFSTVGGGTGNISRGHWATIGGGQLNTSSFGADYATIGGGFNNSISSGLYATIGGGASDTASGPYSAIPGGFQNKATGGYALAAGKRAKAVHRGAFVWADSTDADFASTLTNQFSVRASGGTRIYSNAALTAGVTLAAGASAWAAVSDSTLKRNARMVDGGEILEKLARLPVKRWSYKAQDPGIEHIGPMAQDFYALFGLGDDEKTISTIDPAGVALAAIQELSRQVAEYRLQNERLVERLTELESRLQEVETLAEKKENASLGELR